MGSDGSKLICPYPSSWDISVEEHAAACERMADISGLMPRDFLKVKAPDPDLEEDAWDFDTYLHCAQAALDMDKRLRKKVDRLVGKHLTESEFWRLFYCHAYIALFGDTRCLELSRALLQAADDSTSNAIIANFQGDPIFDALSKKEIDEKLAAGIAKAVANGVIPADPAVEPLYSIDVLGKSAGDVATAILQRLGNAPRFGCVLVLQGLSGTGKGTTVSKLQDALPRAVSWSNGNVFRSLTLLAVAHCEQHGIDFCTETLTPMLMKQLMGCLEFGKFNEKFDIRINGYGFDVLVSQVANTVLKEPRVSKNIPTVAEVTQGEVILFAGRAAEAMRADGVNVLMEGRAQTLNYVRTPHRFELTLAEPITIGMRRAAQRMMAYALDLIGEQTEEPSLDEVRAALQAPLPRMLDAANTACLSKALLDAADDETSNAIIDCFRGDATFQALAQKESDDILRRDAEDDRKLADGIQLAVQRGVVPGRPVVGVTQMVEVLGKTGDEVAVAIAKQLGDAPRTGCVVVLQGLSGTGKGTTVAKLQKMLPKAVCWSNGNIFRALTLLAVTHCAHKDIPFSEEALTPELLKHLMSCLSFGKFADDFDTRIKGCGYNLLVSEVANTLLKEPGISSKIPTVAKLTQGEVIVFAADAAETMRLDGMNVLMEGRAQTLNYVRTQHRFELTLAEPIIIGMRRAAQRMMGRARESLKGQAQPSPQEIRAALQ
eukprot:CAMPEP_0117608740 /NCGR_PEP_ID=MMETSP0784-20121206/80961_1 /TAXON_ID=39447 /ORGANISM="" /LENGTH=715 /DNA_ID=CAMNT_0005412017 /DNA_START=61 /DNA_END=2205 /DNA_ORIENTATION=-